MGWIAALISTSVLVILWFWEVRRRLREIFRLNQSGLAQGYDMILVARTRAVGAEYRELERAFLNVCGKLGLREKKP